MGRLWPALVWLALSPARAEADGCQSSRDCGVQAAVNLAGAVLSGQKSSTPSNDNLVPVMRPRFIHRRTEAQPFSVEAVLPHRQVQESVQRCGHGQWIAGEWEWDGTDWVWANGQCQDPPWPTARYRRFNCETVLYSLRCVPGYWDEPTMAEESVVATRAPWLRLHHVANSLEEL